MNLLGFQETAKNKLKKKIIGLLELSEDDESVDVYFKSPTGSGKTIMSFATIKELENVFVVWIAPNKLHEQSFKKSEDIRTYRINGTNGISSTDAKNIKEKPGECILFLNWSSIDKDEINTMNRESETETDIPSLFKALKTKAVKTVFFIDEGHIGVSKEENQAYKFLKNYSNLNVKISATIETSNNKVEVSREEVIEAGLIVKSVVFNDKSSEFDIPTLTRKAVEKLNEIKEAYKGSVNPLLLVQIGNEDDTNISKEEMISLLIENGIEEDEISIYLSGENTMPSNIDKNLCPIRVVITKVAASTGWDCPRAKVLLGIRKTDSQPFQIQTLGRVCRMPEQKHYALDILDNSFVYTNQSKIEFDEKKPKECIKSGLCISRRNQNILNISILPIVSSDATKFYNKVSLEQLNQIVEGKVFEAKSPISSLSYLQGNIEDIDNKNELSGLNRIKQANKAEDILEKEFDVLFEGLEVIINTISLKKIIVKKIKELKEKTGTPFSIFQIAIGNKEIIEEIVGEVFQIAKFREDEFIKDLFTKEPESFWTIPNEIVHCDNSERKNYNKSLMEPFYSKLDGLEKQYAETLEVDDAVIWWYKNGDNGSEYFSIPYYDYEKQKQRLFYPDFIFLKRVGEEERIFIAETKGGHLSIAQGNKESIQKNKYLEFYCATFNIEFEWEE